MSTISRDAHRRGRNPGSGSVFRAGTPWIVLVACLAATAVLTWFSLRERDAAALEEVRSLAQNTARRLSGQLAASEQVLRGIAGGLTLVPTIDRDQWDTLVTGLEPFVEPVRVAGIGFLPQGLSPGPSLPSARQAETGHSARVAPEGESGFHSSPERQGPGRTGKEMAISAMATDPAHAEAMARAARTLAPSYAVASGQGQSPGTAFQTSVIAYLPVLAPDGAGAEGAAGSVRGYVWGRIPLASLADAVLEQAKGIRLQLLIGEGSWGRPAYDTIPDDRRSAASIEWAEEVVARGGQQWRFRVARVEGVRADILSLTGMALPGLALTIACWLVSLRAEARRLRGIQASEAEARRFVQGVLDVLPSPVLMKDSSQRVVLANRSWGERVGRSPQELVGRADEEFYTGEQAARHAAEDREVMLAGEARTFEERVGDPGPDQRCFVNVKAPLRRPNGDTCVVRCSLDVTAERVHESAAAAGRERVRSFREVLSAIASDAHPSELLAGVMERVGSLLPATAAMYLSAREDGSSELRVRVGETPDASSGGDRFAPESLLEYRRYLETVGPVVVADVCGQAEPIPGLFGLAGESGVAAWVDVPVRRGSEMIGRLIVLSATPRVWSQGDMDLLEDMSAILAAIEGRQRGLSRAESSAPTLVGPENRWPPVVLPVDPVVDRCLGHGGETVTVDAGCARLAENESPGENQMTLAEPANAWTEANRLLEMMRRQSSRLAGSGHAPGAAIRVSPADEAVTPWATHRDRGNGPVGPETLQLLGEPDRELEDMFDEFVQSDMEINRR